MKLSLINASVVVLAQDHNPSILHPAFLSKQGIVPENWTEAEAPICTPPFSIVKYPNGLVFTVETNKLQVMENNPPLDLSMAEAPLRAELYINKLPHVRYLAAGVNFSGLVECTNWETFLLERFITSGPWNANALKATAVGIKFVYPCADAKFTLSLDAGTVKSLKDQGERRGLLVSGNYHCDLDAAKPLDSAVAALKKFSLRASHFKETCTTVLGLET